MEVGFNTLKDDCRTTFQNLASKFTSFVHGRSECDRQQLNSLLDEINALDFRSDVVRNSEVSNILVLEWTSSS
jgi:hypothetical protein